MSSSTQLFDPSSIKRCVQLSQWDRAFDMVHQSPEEQQAEALKCFMKAATAANKVHVLKYFKQTNRPDCSLRPHLKEKWSLPLLERLSQTDPKKATSLAISNAQSFGSSQSIMKLANLLLEQNFTRRMQDLYFKVKDELGEEHIAYTDLMDCIKAYPNIKESILETYIGQEEYGEAFAFATSETITDHELTLQRSSKFFIDQPCIYWMLNKFFTSLSSKDPQEALKYYNELLQRPESLEDFNATLSLAFSRLISSLMMKDFVQDAKSLTLKEVNRYQQMIEDVEGSSSDQTQQLEQQRSKFLSTFIEACLLRSFAIRFYAHTNPEESDTGLSALHLETAKEFFEYFDPANPYKEMYLKALRILEGEDPHTVIENCRYTCEVLQRRIVTADPQKKAALYQSQVDCFKRKINDLFSPLFAAFVIVSIEQGKDLKTIKAERNALFGKSHFGQPTREHGMVINKPRLSVSDHWLNKFEEHLKAPKDSSEEASGSSS